MRGSTAAVRRSQRFRRALERLGLLPAPPEGLAFHAFISYSHAADGPLARALQRGLQRFAKPWNRARALHVFRDEASLAANPNLWEEIERALDASEYYILLASPPAAASYWVRKEAERWLQTKPNDHLFLALTDGSIVWDHSKDDFDWDQTTALPPTLRGAFKDQPPLWVDLRWARAAPDLSLSDPRFTDAVVSLAAPIHGREKDELAGEEVRQQRRTMRIARAAVATLLTLTAIAIVAGIVALIQRSQAISNQKIAQSRELAAASISQLAADPQLSVLLAAQGVRISSTAQSISALRMALAASHQTGMIMLPSSPVSGPAVTADGRFAVVAGEDRVPRVWDLRTGKLAAKLPSHRNPSPGVPTYVTGPAELGTAFSPDGRLAASAGDDGVVDISDWRMGRLIHVLRPGVGPVRAVAFSPDGHLLAVGAPGAVLLYNATSGRLLKKLVTPPGEVQQLMFDRSGDHLVAANLEGYALVWDLRRGAQLTTIKAATDDYLESVAISADGKFIATGSGEGDVKAFDWRSRKVVSDLHPGGDRATVAFATDGRELLTGSSDGKVRIWDWRARREVAELRAHSGAVEGIAIGPAGETVTSGDDSTLRVWQVPASPAVLPTPPVELVHAVALSPDGRMAALGGERTGGNDPVRTAEVWDLHTMRRLASFSEPPVGSGDHQAWLNVSFSRDGRLITGASDTGRVHVWDWSAGHERAVLSRPGEWFRSSAFTPDGSTVAATASDRTIWLWQWRSGRVIGHLREGPQPQQGFYTPGPVAFQPRGRYLAAGDGTTVKVWDWRTRRVQAQLPLPAFAEDVSFDPSGDLLAVAVDDGVTRVWRWRDGRVLSELRGGERDLSTGFGGGTSALVAIADNQGGINLWDWAPEQQVVRFQQVRPPALSFDVGMQDSAFSSDGHTLIGAGIDSKAIVYRCDVCSSVQDLLSLARARVNRKLTDAERRRYLHTP